MAFNKNSNSTPIRLVQTPNRAAPAKERFISDSTSDSLQYEENNDNDQVKNHFVTMKQ